MNKSYDRLMAISNGHASNLRKKGTIAAEIVDEIRVEYWRVGTGSNTIVFVHGNSSCKEVFHEQMNGVDVGDCSLISVDLPGHGSSDNAKTPQKHYTIPGYAKLIGRLMKELNVSNYHVVGWSLGGNIALEMAGQNLPLKSMMIMGAPPIGPGMVNIEKAFLPSSLEAPGKAELSQQEVIDFTNAIYGTLNPIPKCLYLTTERTDGIARETMITHWMAGGKGHNQCGTVSNWKNTIAVIQGENEPFVSLDYLKNTEWKKLWRNQVHVVKSAGHAPFIENPKEFNLLLTEFISGNS